MLRRVKESDLEKLFAYRNDPSIMKWCRQYAPLHWENHLSWYKWQATNNAVSMFTIVDELGDAVGVCGLTDIDYVNRRAEFSCYVAKSYQGRGIAKQALKDLFKIGFHSMGLNRIWGETYDENPAINLFRKMGMVEEGLRKEFYYRDGRYIDCHLISLSRQRFDELFDTKNSEQDKVAS